MVDEGKCEYDVKKQREVLDETISMLPETKSRLVNGFDDLKSFLETAGINDELKETELYQQAQDIIKEVATFLGHETEEAKGDDEEEYFNWCFVALMSDNTLRQYADEKMDKEIARMKLGKNITVEELDDPPDTYEHAFRVKPEGAHADSWILCPESIVETHEWMAELTNPH